MGNKVFKEQIKKHSLHSLCTINKWNPSEKANLSTIISNAWLSLIEHEAHNFSLKFAARIKNARIKNGELQTTILTLEKVSSKES